MVVLKVGLAVGVFSGAIVISRRTGILVRSRTYSECNRSEVVLILLTTDAKSVGSSLKETSILLSSSLDVYGGARGSSDAIVLRRSFPSR